MNSIGEKRLRTVLSSQVNARAGHRLHLHGEKKSALETGRTRLLVMAGVFVLAFAAISGRLVDLTVFKGGQAQATMQRGAPVNALVGRADIVDRNGALVATSLPTVNLYANPRRILDVEEAASGLSRILPDTSYAELVERLSRERSFVYIRRHLTPQQQDAVNRLGIPGLDFEAGERRVYPFGPLTAHAVGLTDVDNRGLSGIERTFDAELRRRGEPLRLSLDVRVQHVLRDELSRAMDRFQAIGAAGLILDARSGEVLSMVSLPDFDPNRPGPGVQDALFNRASLGVYEMGSTFKLFTAAMALESGAATLNSGYDASRPMRVARYTIRDFHPQNRFLSLPEIIVHSSNIGSAKMAVDVGTEGQRAFLGKLGLLSRATIELPETGAPLAPNPWREINTMTIAYGHGLAVTPLHMVNATAALVNGGTLRNATLLAQNGPVEGRRVLSEETSRLMRALMRLVVEEGTGGKAEVPGYLVGGKTGTAEKLSPTGGYARGSRLTSFIGAFPMDEPRYVVLTVLDEPKGIKETFGFGTAGWNAAPTAGRVIKRAAPLLGVEPTDTFALDQSRAASLPVITRPGTVGGMALVEAGAAVPTGGPLPDADSGTADEHTAQAVHDVGTALPVRDFVHASMSSRNGGPAQEARR